MSDFFYSIVEDLYSLYKIEPPQEISNTIFFTMKNGVKIGMEMHSQPQGILMMAVIGSLPKGVSRFLWLQESLRWNSNQQICGTLSLDKQQDQLVLGCLFNLELLTAQIIYEAIPLFSARALLWKEALSAGYPPSLPGAIEINAEPSPFSLPSNRYTSRIRP
jgi:hypothetical protein